MQSLKLRQPNIIEETRKLDRQLGAKAGRVTPEKVDHLAAFMRMRLRDAESPQMRKRYGEAFVGEIEMTKELITIRGPVRSLEMAVDAAGTPLEGVRSFIRNWRARDDINGHSDHWEILVSLQ